MKAAKPEIIKTTIRCPKQLWNRVQHLAIDENTSAEAIVVKALAQFLTQFPKGGK